MTYIRHNKFYGNKIDKVIFVDSTDDDEVVQYCWYTNHEVYVSNILLDFFDDLS